MGRSLSVFVGWILLSAGVIQAADTPPYIPEDLKPWRSWVLEGQEYRQCPFFFHRDPKAPEDYLCAWPGALDLTVDARSGSFTQEWTVYGTDEWIPLPGDASHWPQLVTVGGKSVAVILRGERPVVRLGPGRHLLRGRFSWEGPPHSLKVPPQSGWVRLKVAGQQVDRPERTAAQIWLGEREQEKKAEDALQVQVYRLVTDDVPTRLVSVFRLESSGSVREELLGPALPEGFVPLAIDSGLPARLEPDGNLRLQVRPGTWEVTLRARATDVLPEVVLPAPARNLPGTEIWSYESSDPLRVTVPEGVPSVDPMQTGVPQEWVGFPSFRVDAGEALKISERSRGAIGAGNQLRLGRQLWLDFNGDGYVFSDGIQGNMRSGWRLDMAQPYALLSATEDDENLLVTRGSDESLTGVEVRKPEVSLHAVGRTESTGRLPVTGWQASFNAVQATVHLPPGAKLLAATGADRSSMSWVNRWKLLDFFLVLIVSISAVRLFGYRIGALTLVALILSLHEMGAPKFVWLSLLIAVALVRVAPKGALKNVSRGYLGLSLVVLGLIFVPFAVGQLRIAIYPQLEPQGQSRSDSVMHMPPAPKGAMTGIGYVEEQEPTSDRLEKVVSSYAPPGSRPVLFNRYAPNAIVQVGPGRPSWRWNSYSLSWSGPVNAEQTMRLVVMPRWLVSGLRFVLVGLLAVLLAVFGYEFFGKRFGWTGLRPPGGGSAVTSTAICIVVVLGSTWLTAPPAIGAQIPPDSLLRELETRLTAPPDCAPRCAEVVAADVKIDTARMSIRLTVDSLATVAVPLPGSLQGWRPEQIVLDGSPAKELHRGPDGSLWVRITPGRHEIRTQGPLPPVDSLEVPFPTPPRVVRVDTSGWFVAGVDAQRLLSGSLQLTRLQTPKSVGNGEGSATRWESSRFPVFVRVERSISLDLDWRVSTTVHRVAPLQGAVSIQVPLLAGESVITEGLAVKEGEITISMNPAEQFVSWDSTLPRSSPFTVRTPETMAWKEVWRFSIGGIWHAQFSGVPESDVAELGHGFRVAQFFPRAGEELTMTVERPEASVGDSLVFDAVRLSSQIGARSRTANLSLDYRSTRGAQHPIDLPPDAEIVGVTIDGKSSPLRAENGELRLPILPGAHNVSIDWRRDRPIGLRESSPPVDLRAAASNIHTKIQLAPNRWVLATSGPRLGPAVLYWSELLVLVLLALLMGKEKLTPLRRRDWLLLGLGFSTFSWLALALVVLWLLVAGAAAPRKETLPPLQANGIQLILAGLSLVALATIVVSLPMGLLGRPDMHILGNESHGNQLNWFADRSDSSLPGAGVFSVPLWIYKALILGWALWLSFALLRWLPWVWRQFVSGGIWKSAPKKA